MSLKRQNVGRATDGENRSGAKSCASRVGKAGGGGRSAAVCAPLCVCVCACMRAHGSLGQLSFGLTGRVRPVR